MVSVDVKPRVSIRSEAAVQRRGALNTELHSIYSFFFLPHKASHPQHTSFQNVYDRSMMIDISTHYDRLCLCSCAYIVSR